MLRGIGRIYLSVVTVLFLFGAYYIGFSFLASAKERDVNEAWTKTLGSSFDLAAKFPKTKKNATAQMMEEMTNKDQNPFGLTGPMSQPTWNGGWKVLNDELDKPANQPVNLPPAVRDYLNAHQKQFSIIYNQVHKEGPQWDTNFEEAGREPLPNLSAAHTITKLIALDALNKHQSGQTEAAREAMQAGWKIDQALHTRPEMVSQVVASTIDDVQFKVMRRMGGSAAQWQKQTQSIDYEKAAQWCLAISAKHISQRLSDDPDLFPLFSQSYGKFPGRGSKLGIVLTSLARPYLRVCAANNSEAYRRTVEAYKAGKSGTNYIAWWNIPGKTSVVDIRFVEKMLSRAQGKPDRV